MPTTMIASPSSPKRGGTNPASELEYGLTRSYDQIRAAEAAAEFEEIDSIERMMSPRDVWLCQVMSIELWQGRARLEAVVEPEENAHRVTAITYYPARSPERHMNLPHEDYPSIWRYAEHLAATF